MTTILHENEKYKQLSFEFGEIATIPNDCIISPVVVPTPMDHIEAIHSIFEEHQKHVYSIKVNNPTKCAGESFEVTTELERYFVRFDQGEYLMFPVLT